MSTYSHRMVSTLVSLIPFNILIQSSSANRIIFPFYHLVSDKPVLHIKNLYQYKSQKAFEKDLDFLLKHYRPLSTAEIRSVYMEGAEIRDKGFWLSFDDGLREFGEVAAPILLRKGIPATNFLNPAFLDNKDLFYRYKVSLLLELIANNTQKYKLLSQWIKTKKVKKTPEEFLLSIDYHSRALIDQASCLVEYNFKEYLETERPYLTIKEVQQLQKQGFEFGAHSLDHPLFSLIPVKEQLSQARESLKIVSAICGQPIDLFAFPFSDHGVGQTFFNLLNEENRILTFGTTGMKKDLVKTNIQRIAFERTRESGKQIIKREFMTQIIRSLAGKNIIKRN